MSIVYVGCSLTQASPVFVQEVETLKALLRKEGHAVPDFVGLVAGSALTVYETDIHKCVDNCDMFLAICDHPSIGLGWEIGTAVERHRKPVLAVAHTDAKVSRLVIGAACDRNPRYRFRRYTQMEEVILLVDEFLKEMRVHYVNR